MKIQFVVSSLRFMIACSDLPAFHRKYCAANTYRLSDQIPQRNRHVSCSSALFKALTSCKRAKLVVLLYRRVLTASTLTLLYLPLSVGPHRRVTVTEREREASVWTFANSVRMVVLEICAVVLVVLVIAAAISEKVRSAVISSNTYKKAFAVHMNLFSRIHNKAVRKRKEAMFALMKQSLNDVQGDILEIGAGTGANFEFLPEGSSVIALEPNPHMEAYLVENAEKFPHVHLKKIVPGFAENMEGIADDSVAAVVCTLTLCSVHDMEAALTEIKRVLKPVSSRNM